VRPYARACATWSTTTRPSSDSLSSVSGSETARCPLTANVNVLVVDGVVNGTNELQLPRVA